MAAPIQHLAKTKKLFSSEKVNDMTPSVMRHTQCTVIQLLTMEMWLHQVDNRQKDSQLLNDPSQVMWVAASDIM